MDLKFEVSGRISRPVSEVFEAVVNPEKLSGYFTTGGAKGRLETGATVTWDFHDFPGAFPVHVVEVEKDKRIILKWGANDPGAPQSYDTTVTMRFEPTDDGRTIVTIAEEGWRETPAGLKSSYGNCMGWSQMLCAMKAYVEHGINLREGMYK
ncbi:MAG: SRPBCC family protein [Alphaproteobacteria bacterium]|nr:SRPBCC family protein [Alphaproteobacteria bacterium]MBU2082667.1 SRPBCC family protein [Alphaproteobacteria bacterium]MBU2142236.1 SRPBCC family protein [Alphaproteobacteria bacterium]MBU2196721.1 SRPBCC family protein [Alphaproteobacteria bacterium]